MVLGFRKLCFTLLLFGCTDAERNNPYDERASNYMGNSSIEPSSSSLALSSSSVELSSSSVAPSSSSSIPICGENEYNPEEEFCDGRDNKLYKCVEIGTQTWMAENLNYNASGSKCYGNYENSCQKYGRLYDWNKAMESCPSGWHLPSKDEWNVLINYAGGEQEAADKLKAENGFAALLGGGFSNGNFNGVNEYGIWWSANNDDDDKAYYYYIDQKADSSVAPITDYLFSVRCVRDN